MFHCTFSSQYQVPLQKLGGFEYLYPTCACAKVDTRYFVFFVATVVLPIDPIVWPQLVSKCT